MNRYSFVLTLFLINFLGFFGVALAGPSGDQDTPSKIVWEEEKLDIQAVRGTSQLVSASFRYEGERQNIEAWFTPSIDGFFGVLNRVLLNADDAGMATVELVASIPADAEARIHRGTLHLRYGTRTISKPLKIRIEVLPLESILGEELPNLLPSVDRISSEPESDRLVVVDELAVVFKPGTSAESARAIVEPLGGFVTGRVAGTETFKIQFPDLEGQHDLLQIAALIGEYEPTLAVAQSWLDEPRTKCNFSENITVPSDQEWDCWSERPTEGNNAAYEFLQFPTAWNSTTGNSENPVVIGVIDTNFDLSHRDLNNNIAFSNIAAGSSLGDDHGTAVAGIIGAEANNEGITGTLWHVSMGLYSNCVYIPFKGCKIEGFTAMAQMQAAINRGAEVINYSGGASYSSPASAAAPNAVWAATVIDRNPDVLFVFAAGQAGDGDTAKDDSTSSPSSLSYKDNVIGVTNMQGGVRLADGSVFGAALADSANFGANLVAAPGCGFLITTPGSNYEFFNGGGALKCGTSFATPFVTGLAGLLLSLDDQLKADQVKAYIMDGARQAGVLVSRTGGNAIYAINAARSMELASDEPLVRGSAKATITFTYDIDSDGRETNGEVTPIGVGLGDEISVEFVYDPTQPDGYPNDPVEGVYFYSPASPTNISLRANGFRTSQVQSAFVLASNNARQGDSYRSVFQIQGLGAAFPSGQPNMGLIQLLFITLFEVEPNNLLFSDKPPTSLSEITPSEAFLKIINYRSITRGTESEEYWGFQAEIDLSTFSLSSDP